ncbi:MAG: pilus assembly protein [Planctomycetales bacterium]|nr:pilus assembly protein [Planctomycetales bacterium]
MKSMLLKSRCRPQRRSGQLAVQALLVIPILLAITIATVEFGIVLTLRRVVTSAAIQASREAGQGADADEVAADVETTLAAFNLALGPDLGVRLEDPELAIDESRGLACDAPASALSNGRVRVTVCVPTAGTPVVGFLEGLGYNGVLGNTLTASAVAQKECP